MNINLIGRRKVWYIISLLIIIPGIFSLFIQGLNLGIDFTGGNLIQVKFEQNVTSAQVRNVFSEHVKEGISVQETDNNNFLIRTPVLTEEQGAQVISSLTSQLGKNEILRNELVGPLIGKELALNALYALAIASVLMVVYITFRFEFKFALAAIAALLHDVLIVVVLFSIFQIEIDSAFVAAILTIIGYSVNDTIVVFDRIRENLRGNKKEDRELLVNRSVIQTLSRSINTVLTTLFPLIALLLFGGATIKVFALALLIGITSGCYSSIFIASPLWLDLSKRLGERKARA
ncbi:MAG: protein translocase subunit SecF [Dehalobacterium sp.]